MGLHNLTALQASRHAALDEQEPQVIEDLGQRADRGPGFSCTRPPADGNGRRQVPDELRVGLVKSFEELADVGRKALQIAALGLRVQRIENEAALTRSAYAGDHRQFPQGHQHVDALQVVNADAAERDGWGIGHVSKSSPA